MNPTDPVSGLVELESETPHVRMAWWTNAPTWTYCGMRVYFDVDSTIDEPMHEAMFDALD